MQNKNEFDHLQDYVLLANAVNSMTGRANIGNLSTQSKTLAAVFFSAKMRLQCKPVNPIITGI
jgi:hypothetical protein